MKFESMWSTKIFRKCVFPISRMKLLRGVMLFNKIIFGINCLKRTFNLKIFVINFYYNRLKNVYKRAENFFSLFQNEKIVAFLRFR